MTPQVARIDAHLLNRRGVARLCYCDSVLHTLPTPQASSREPIQLGAELFGHAGIEADLEVLRLLAAALDVAGTPASRIDIGHVGVFRALANAAGLESADEEIILQLLQNKDVPGLREFCGRIAEPCRSALMLLPELFGGDELIEVAARRLPDLPEIAAALATLKQLRIALPDQPLSFDLADLHGYHYHNGVVFAAYFPGYASAIARGGRYDGVGAYFGRRRPATGFSMDLREIARLAGYGECAGGILSPWALGDKALSETVDALRAQGETVVELLPGQTEHEGLCCDRHLVLQSGKWVIQAIDGK